MKSLTFLKISMAFILSCCLLDPASADNKNARPNETGPWPEIQVNTYTGNLFYQRTDLYIPAKGDYPLEIIFSYNSLKQEHDKGYGNGWTFNFGMYYKPVGNTIVVFREEGEEDIFTWDGAMFVPPPGVYDALTEYETGKYLLRTKYGMRYYFEDDSHKHLTKITDRNNNTITLSYTDGKPTTITDPSGRMLNLSWVGDHLSLLTDPNTTPSRVIAFTYDGSWNVTQVSRPLTNIYLYGYDAYGNMTSVTDPRLGTVTISYDVNDAVAGLQCAPVSYNKTFTYDNCDNTTTVHQTVSALPRQTIYTYDLTGRITKIKHADGLSVFYAWDGQNNLMTYTNKAGNSTSYAYDPMGNLLSETDFMGFSQIYTYESTYNQVTSYINKNGAPTTYSYDGFGNRLTIMDCGSLSESYTYDGNGNLTSKTDRRGFVTTYLHNSYGDLIKITGPDSFFDIFTYDPAGNMITSTDKRGFTTTLTYDLLNRHTGTSDAHGYTSSYSYDGTGNLTSETNQNSQTIDYTYNQLNRRIGQTDDNGGTTSYTFDEAGNILTETNARGFTTTYTYDSMNRMISLKDALNNTENYTYDPIGNLTVVSDKNGNLTSYEYDKLSRVTKITWPDSFFDIYTFDPAGNRTSHTNKNGAIKTYTYDCHNRLTLTNHPMPGITESYTYDQVGNILTYTNKNGIATTYTYDAMARVATKSDPLPGTESYTYDATGNLTGQTDKMGYSTTFNYDNINRKTGAQFPMGLTEAYTYDGVGNMLTITDRRGNTTTYLYDNLNRLQTMITPLGKTESFTYDAVGNQTASTDKNGNTTTYLYDGMNQKTRTTDPLGFFEIYNYNAVGNMTSLLDKNGGNTTLGYSCCRLTSKSDPLGATEYYGYDNVGNKTSLTDKNGNTTIFAYDALNRLTQTTTPLGNQTILTYDGEGNTLSRRDANLNMVNYTYNARNELTLIAYPFGTTKSYTYDNNGNLLQATYTGGIGDNTTHTYDALNRLISKATDYGPLFTKTINYGYDQNSNNTLVSSDTGPIQYQFDNDNRLIQATDPSGMVTSFEHDNNGNQTAIHYPNGVSTYTTYDAMNRVLSVSTNDIPPPPVSKPGSLTIKDTGGKILSPMFVMDYAVSNILEPNSGPGLGENELVTIEITNFGMTMSMDVMASFSVNGVPSAPELIPIPIQPEGGIGVYTFLQTADLSEPGQDYIIEACVDVMGDENPINDCMIKVVTNEGGGGGAVYQSFTYGYDQMGNKTWEEYQDGTHINLTYSLNNELLSETTFPSAEMVFYTYTPTGQRESKTDNGIISLYEYNDDDILILAGGVTYIPDNNGNRISLINPDGDITTYLYGFDDELKQVNLPGGQSVHYDYSALGLLINRIENGIPTYYLNLGRELLNQYNAAGSVTTFRNPGISITQGSQIGYNFNNGHGSATLQMDPAKTIIATSTFDSYGIVTSSTGAWINNEVTFSFSLWDELSDLYHKVKGHFVDLFTGYSINPNKGEGSRPGVSNPEGGKVVDENDPKPGVEEKKAKCCGVKKFVVKWTESPWAATGRMVRIDVEIEFMSDDAHDPACCKFCQNVQTVYTIKNGPWKGSGWDSSPMHDDNYSRGRVVDGKVVKSDDTDGNQDLSDPGFTTNDNPGWESFPADNDIDYKFTAEQMVIENCEDPCPKGATVAKRGPHTAHITGKVPRSSNGTLPKTFE